MEDRFKGPRTMYSYHPPRKVGLRTPRPLYGSGSRRCWGLEEVILPPPSFPVTTAHALHDLLKCETNAVTKSLIRGYKRHHKIPKPPELLSTFSLRASPPPPRKPHYPGSRSSTILGSESLVARSPSKMLAGSIFFPADHTKSKHSRSNMRGSLRGPGPTQSSFQPKGLKTQGARATILSELEQYRLNSQARSQLKQRADPVPKN